MGNHGFYEAELTFANATLLDIFSIGWDNPFWTIDETHVDEQTGAATITMSAEGKMFEFIKHEMDSPAFWRTLRIVSATIPNVWMILTGASIYSYSRDGIEDDIDVDWFQDLLTPEQVAKVMAAASRGEDSSFSDAMGEWAEENDANIWDFFNYHNLADYCSPWGYRAELELVDGKLEIDAHEQDWDVAYKCLARDYHLWIGDEIDAA